MATALKWEGGCHDLFDGRLPSRNGGGLTSVGPIVHLNDWCAKCVSVRIFATCAFAPTCSKIARLREKGCSVLLPSL